MDVERSNSGLNQPPARRPEHVLGMQADSGPARQQPQRPPPDQAFYVAGNGWTEASRLRPGDFLRTFDRQDVTIESMTDTGEEVAAYQMNAARPSFPCAGLWPAGMLLETADGLKPIEAVKPGDYRVPCKPLDPERN